MKTFLFVLFGGLMVFSMLDATHAGAAHKNVPSLQGASLSADTPTGNADVISPGWLIFDDGSSNLSPAIQQSLNQLGRQMQGKPAARVVIVTQGGGAGSQQKLSEARANAIVQYLVSNYNIPASQVASTVSDGIDDANAVNFHQEP